MRYQLNRMKQQLELTAKQLQDIGFIGNHSPADENEGARVCYTMSVVNGEFIYNERGEYGDGQYKWYLKTIIGEAANYIWLNVESIEDLYIVLSCFRVKYNLVINWTSQDETITNDMGRCSAGNEHRR